MLMVAAVAEARGHFGQYLATLRGKERPSDVARRINMQITPQYLSVLEEKADPGDIKPKTLMALAEAYWEDHYPSVEDAFWDLWKRVGYPLPAGYAELTPRDRALLAHLRSVDDEVRQQIEDEVRRTVEEHLKRERGDGG